MQLVVPRKLANVGCVRIMQSGCPLLDTGCFQWVILTPDMCGPCLAWPVLASSPGHLLATGQAWPRNAWPAHSPHGTGWGVHSRMETCNVWATNQPQGPRGEGRSRVPSIGWKHQPYPINQPIALTSTILMIGSCNFAWSKISKIHQKTAKSFGALKINVTDLFLKESLKKLISP